jgi:hypothetical protein
LDIDEIGEPSARAVSKMDGWLDIYGAKGGKILPVLPVLERIKWALLTKITTF